MHNFSLQTIVPIITGFILCFVGWRTLELSRKIIGFIVGSTAGYVLMEFLIIIIGYTVPSQYHPWIVAFFSIISGLLGVCLVKTIIKLILFIAGFLVGIVLIAMHSGSVTSIAENFYRFEVLIDNISVWSLLAGLIFGILFVFMQKIFIVSFSSFLGAYLVASQLRTNLVFFYALLLLGAIAQFWTSRAHKVDNLRISKD